MPILDAALAFALTMLVVATVVTYIVRLMQSIAKLRNKQLQAMLQEFWAQEVKPVVERELDRLQKKVGASVVSQLRGLTDQLKGNTLFNDTELAQLVDVPTEELTERLKRSEPGGRLLAELGDDAQAIFDELGRRYEIVGDRFTESFRKYSRWWTTIAALVLALVINIDSIHIANSYIRSQTVRESALAQMQSIMANYDAKVGAVTDTNGPIAKQTLEQAINDSRAQIDTLTAAGFPLGWSYFPHAGLKDLKSPEFESNNNLGGWVMWILGVMLTGVLAGLGAPFWYDTVTGISRAVQQTRIAKKPAA